ncbi:N-acetyltransferase family protein [Cupriavidus basilensis]
MPGPESGNLIIRLANQADAAAISAIHAVCWHQTYGGLFPGRDAFDRDERKPAASQVSILLADASVICFVATSNMDIVGFADCGPYREAGQECRGEVYALYVLQSFHDRRIGKSFCRGAPEPWLGGVAIRCTCGASKATHEHAGFNTSTGGRLLGRRASVRGSMILDEVEYQWDLAGMNGLAMVEQGG